MVGICKQREWQIELVAELGLRGLRIWRYSDEYRVSYRELLVCVAKLARFDRSARGVSLRIKEHNHTLAGQRGQRKRVAILIFGFAFRYCIVNL